MVELAATVSLQFTVGWGTTKHRKGPTEGRQGTVKSHKWLLWSGDRKGPHVSISVLGFAKICRRTKVESQKAARRDTREVAIRTVSGKLGNCLQ